MIFRSIGQKVNIPLFKYYGSVDYARDAIENSRIHLEEPSMYNDIYDSSVTLTEEGLKKAYFGNYLKIDSIRCFCKNIQESELKEIEDKRLFVGEIIDCLCDIDKEIDKDVLVKQTIAVFTSNKGIIQADNNKISCFSEVNDSLLMWAYYAKNYSGVCIRFDPMKDNLLLENCRKVQYTNHFISDDSFGNYFRKSIQWSHEQEWRIVCETDEEYLPVNCIDAIYLGLRTQDDVIEQFKTLGKMYNLEVYKMKLSDMKYEISFERIL